MQQPDPNNANNNGREDCIASRTRGRVRAAATNRDAAAAAPTEAAAQPAPRGPLTQQQIDQIPGYKYEPPKCAICLDVFQEADFIRTLRCHHEFHSVCLVTWLGNHTTCPVCRRKVAVDRNAGRDLQRALAG